MKQAVLFKNTGLSVHRIGIEGDSSAENAKAELRTKDLSIPLDSAAAEVLVGYLQVMRGYLSYSGSSNEQVRMTFEQLAVRLEQQLRCYGRMKAGSDDITELIQQMGCLHDWTTGRASVLPD